MFGLGEVAFAAWTLAAFSIGALAGMLIRRVVPAIAATLAVYAGLALATGLWLRERYMTPLLTSNPTCLVPRGAWASGTTKGGKFAFAAQGSQLVRTVTRLCPPRIRASKESLARCAVPLPVRIHAMDQLSARQPVLGLPVIEGGWQLVLSMLLIAVTVWLVRRRAA